MSEELIDLGNGFRNIRGNFRIGGVINVGTQCSLVELPSGRFVFLDSYTLQGDIRQQVMALTDNGRLLEAVLNVHPFHTVHCEQMARDFPRAVFYGSQRHHRKVPQVRWAEQLVESPFVAARYPELEFALPEGIEYISANENVHAGSLLAYHPASRTLHVDDTFAVLPRTLRALLPFLPDLMVHPTAKQALKKQAGAGKAFCDWAEGLARRWEDTRQVCAAHSALKTFGPGEFQTALLAAVARARPQLERV